VESSQASASQRRRLRQLCGADFRHCVRVISDSGTHSAAMAVLSVPRVGAGLISETLNWPAKVCQSSFVIGYVVWSWQVCENSSGDQNKLGRTTSTLSAACWK